MMSDQPDQPDTSDAWRAALERFSEGLVASTERIRQALVSVASAAAEEMGAAESSVLVPAAGESGLRFLASHSPHADKLAELRVPIDSSLAGRVYVTGQLLATEDERPAIPVPGEPPKVYLAFPLNLNDKTLGVATYVNRRGEPPFQRFEVRDFEIASRYAVPQAVLLRHYLRSQTLARISAEDLNEALDDGWEGKSPAPSRDAPGDDVGDELWRQAAARLSDMNDNEQILCSTLVRLVRDWSNGTLE